VNSIRKYGALAALIAAGFSTAALADSAETKGGLTVKTDDGRFEMKIGGRFHIDAYAFDGCSVNSVDCPNGTDVGGMFMRRGYLTTTGKMYGWKYKHEFDLAASSSNPQATWREAWVSTEALGGEIMIGQFKPFRSMEELTSSNEILMMERPYSSASALYAGGGVGSRQFQMGVGYKLPFSFGQWGLSVYNLHSIGAAANEGVGASTRLTFLPVESERANVHLGLVYGQDDANRSGTGTPLTVGVGSATLAGRTSSTQVVSPTQGGFGSAAAGESQTTYSAEAAASFGPGFLQAEYANSTLAQAAGTPDQDVTSYYLQGSFFITGETKPYKKDRATFGSPKPNNESGAWEITARYDFIENGDAATKPEATQITAGVNYYINPNVRLMLNYSMGEGETTTTKTEIDAIALRTQLSF
jgi:phosphate-selective porin OprO/OprP